MLVQKGENPKSKRLHFYYRSIAQDECRGNNKKLIERLASLSQSETGGAVENLRNTNNSLCGDVQKYTIRHSRNLWVAEIANSIKYWKVNRNLKEEFNFNDLFNEKVTVKGAGKKSCLSYGM